MLKCLSHDHDLATLLYHASDLTQVISQIRSVVVCLDGGDEVEVAIWKRQAGDRTVVDRNATTRNTFSVRPERGCNTGARIV